MRKSKVFRTIPWPSCLDEDKKIWFPAVKHALWELDSICAPTERHILIAHEITNRDFGAYCLPSSSSWKMAQHSWKWNREISELDWREACGIFATNWIGRLNNCFNYDSKFYSILIAMFFVLFQNIYKKNPI